ncbi:hypothetical protein HRbin33_01584 [bacterium HR33]|nr:hypothetical protein HRbin33_01584 [bacterium HR33]
MARLIRWKALVPLALALAALAVFWMLYLDLAVERAIEYAGSEIVGARVDVASVDVRLTDGTVVVRGLEVADPDRPMRNLVEAREIVAAVELRPLLEKKLVLDTVAVRGIRFGTPRRESGALERRSGTTGAVYQRVSSWARSIEIPALNLEGLGTVVNLQGLSPDSLKTLARARALGLAVDSLAGTWRAQLASLAPAAELDSARALVTRLREANLRALGIAGARRLLESSRAQAAALENTAERLRALEEEAARGLELARTGLNEVGRAREEDYAYARRLVKLPQLDAPDLSTSLFGEMVLERVRPILYWVHLAERYLPPGLDPRTRVGPKRLRAAGLTVEFPRKETHPPFLLRLAEIDLEIGGRSAVAGRYDGRLEGLTSAPSIYGRPTVVSASWTSSATRGLESGLRVIVDHVSVPVEDSVQLRLRGVVLPAVTVTAVGAQMGLGAGNFSLDLFRRGDQVEGRLLWESRNVSWEPMAGSLARQGDPAAPVGSGAWARALVWRTVSSLRNVEIEARIWGSLSAPRLGLRSNVGQEVSRALRQAIGAEIARAEQRVRAEVDRMVAAQVREAEAKVAELRSLAEGEVARRRAELEGVRQELEAEIRNFARRVLPD